MVKQLLFLTICTMQLNCAQYRVSYQWDSDYKQFAHLSNVVNHSSYDPEIIVEFLELTLRLFNSPEASMRQKALQTFIECSKNIDSNHYRAKYILDHFFQEGIYALLNQGVNRASLYEELYKYYKSTHNSYALQRLWGIICVQLLLMPYP